MRTSIWYRTEERNPDRSGYYLAYRGWGMGGAGDNDHDHGYLYYNKKKDEWFEYVNGDECAFVYYWTTATPDKWTDRDPPSIHINKNTRYKATQHADDHVAVQDAWRDVEEAVKRYEAVKALCEKP